MVDSPYNVEASAFLQSARKTLGLRQADLAVELGKRLGVPVSQSALSGWETGVRTVPGPVLAVVLEQLGHALGELGTMERVEPDVAARLGAQVQAVSSLVAEALDTLAERPTKTNVDRIRDLARRAHEVTHVP